MGLGGRRRPQDHSGPSSTPTGVSGANCSVSGDASQSFRIFVQDVCRRCKGQNGYRPKREWRLTLPQRPMSIAAEDEARDETFRLVAPAVPRTLAWTPRVRRDDHGRTPNLSPLRRGDRSLASLQRCPIFHTAWIWCIDHLKLPLPRLHNGTVQAIVWLWKGHHRGSDSDPDPGKRF
jgi:hypothetical protein